MNSNKTPGRDAPMTKRHPAEQTVEHTIEQNIEQNFEQKTIQNAEHTAVENIEQRIEQDLEQKSRDKFGVKSEVNAGIGGKTGKALEELYHTVACLRAPDGCPWDRVQTHESIKAACVEEAAEVVCGINILTETGRAQSLKEELGDLLFQVVMHAQMAEEEGLFTLEDVIRGVNEKMLRRHPHVFGEESLKYLPEGYVEYMQESHSEARQNPQASECTDARETTEKRRTEAQKSPGAVLADWKEIKRFEKLGREWEEDYLFRAFDEAEELIAVARKRKLEKKY